MTENGEIRLFDKTGLKKALCFSLQQTSLGQKEGKLPCPDRQSVFFRGGRRNGRCFGINQQNQITAACEPGPQIPVGLPAKPPGPVPFHSVPETAGKSKTYPVAGQAVFQHKELSAAAAEPLTPAENFPNLVPSL
jgi:hypothetical protein